MPSGYRKRIFGTCGSALCSSDACVRSGGRNSIYRKKSPQNDLSSQPSTCYQRVENFCYQRIRLHSRAFRMPRGTADGVGAAYALLIAGVYGATGMLMFDVMVIATHLGVGWVGSKFLGTVDGAVRASSRAGVAGEDHC